MSKQNKYTPVSRRSTFKKHSDHYKKIYHPFLPLLFIVGLSAAIVLAHNKASQNVLSYAENISSNSLLQQTNEQRRKVNSTDLSLNANLTQAAQEKANDMAERNYWSHLTPDGSQPWVFISKHGYNYSAAAENLAYGFLSSESTINGWMNSQAHRESLLSNNYSEVGFGIANAPNYQGKGAETIVVAMYANPSLQSGGMEQSKVAPETASKITFAQAFTKGYAPWINFAAGILVGLSAMYLAVHHTFQLRRKLKKGEKFIIRHPTLDFILIIVIVMGLLISQTAGFIH